MLLWGLGIINIGVSGGVDNFWGGWKLAGRRVGGLMKTTTGILDVVQNDGSFGIGGPWESGRWGQGWRMEGLRLSRRTSAAMGLLGGLPIRRLEGIKTRLILEL